MDKESIIRMAQKAGFWGSDIRYQDSGELERFAALVAEAEREGCAKLAESLPMQQEIDVRDQCAAAIRARG